MPWEHTVHTPKEIKEYIESKAERTIIITSKNTFKLTVMSPYLYPTVLFF